MTHLAHNAWKFLHKLLNAVEKLPGLARPMTGPRMRALREKVLTRYVYGLPDRRYWAETIMPNLLNAGFERILFVGCEVYNAPVPEQFEAHGIECWTTDIIPENAVWGHPERHIVCDIADITGHFPESHFDAVLFNGVMGYGVTGAHMTTIAPALHAVLRAPGFLLIGWNKGLVEDPLTLPAVTSRFAHQQALGLPARKEFPDTTHVYDLFVKLPERSPL